MSEHTATYALTPDERADAAWLSDTFDWDLKQAEDFVGALVTSAYLRGRHDESQGRGK